MVGAVTIGVPIGTDAFVDAAMVANRKWAAGLARLLSHILGEPAATLVAAKTMRLKTSFLERGLNAKFMGYLRESLRLCA